MSCDNRETRETLEPIELRALPGKKGPGTLVGYAAVFNSFSRDLGGFVEIIRPGAFAAVVERSKNTDTYDDVPALFDHDPKQRLGRSSSGTLRLAEDERGLRYEIDLPDSRLGHDVAEEVRRRDVRGSSFGMRVAPADQTWRKEGPRAIREIRRVAQLLDVSPVYNPAYIAADVALRSFNEWQQASNPAADADLDRRLKLVAARLRLLG